MVQMLRLVSATLALRIPVSSNIMGMFRADSQFWVNMDWLLDGKYKWLTRLVITAYLLANLWFVAKYSWQWPL